MRVSSQIRGINCHIYFIVKIVNNIHWIKYVKFAKKKQYQKIHQDFHLKIIMGNTGEN